MNNPYSKFRYENSFNVKVRSDGSVFGADMKGSVNSQLIKEQLGDGEVASSFWGTTWVTNYIYRATRINNVDSTVVPSKRVYFKFFKL